MNPKHHPKGLTILFLTEMWERFSFYGLRALLVLYLTQSLDWTDASAYSLFGAYAALVYATPVIGGFIADRLLGLRKAVFLGGFLIMLGHFTLAIPGDQLFYVGLAFVVCGTGYLKSCISGMVGELYGIDDPRADSGFTIFYMGINLGAFGAGIAVGYVAQIFGWHAGFGLAGIGMLLGLLTYLYGQRYLIAVGDPSQPERLENPGFMGFSIKHMVWIGSFLAVPLVAQLLQYPQFVGWLLLPAIVISAFILSMLARRVGKSARRKLFGLIVLIIFAIGFFSLFEQGASSINLFTERGVDRALFDWVIPTPAFQSLNPLFILLLAPVFASLWVWLNGRGMEPSTPTKFVIALLLVSISFAILAVGASRGIGSASMGWLVASYLLQTLGELCLSPVGLSAVSRYSPRGHVGMMMGIWFLAMSTSNYLAAMMAKLAAVAIGTFDIQAHYAHAFTQIFVIGLVVTALMVLVSFPLKRLLS